MSNTHLITVAIPAFNHELYILETLESVKNSTWPTIELLIIDDGSRDNTFQVASAWIDKNRSRFSNANIRQQENKGVCKTLNRLIQDAQGEYVAIIASDDRLLPSSLEVRSTVLALNSWADAIFSDSDLIDENGDKLPGTLHLNRKTFKPLLLNRDLQYFEILLNWRGCGPGLMIRKRKIPCQDLEFDENILFEDFEFFLRKSHDKALAYIPDPLQEYRISPQSFSHDKGKKNQMRLAEIQSLMAVYKRTLSFKKIVTLLRIWRFKTADSKIFITRLLSRYLFGVLCRLLRSNLKLYLLVRSLLKSRIQVLLSAYWS